VTASLTFLGAAGTVTGAKFCLETAGARVLLECGLFQGLRELRDRNWAPFPVPAASLDAIVVSHAHIDHSGYLPRMMREGFDGAIRCSAGTADLLRVLLPDAARLQEEEAEYRNRKGKTRHRPALPLYTEADAEAALERLAPVGFGEPFPAGRGVEVRLHPSGHILGASIVEVVTGARRLVYSGDLGRYDVPVLRDPAPVTAADVLLVESTYGNRRHPPDDGTAVLVEAVSRAVATGGALLIPAFAVGRTQDILYTLRGLEEAGRIPAVPVVLDSPMGVAATAVYARHPEEHDADATRVAREGGRPFVPRHFSVTATVEDSKRLNALEGPAVVIAGSGMANGGRILHHFRRRLGDARTTVLFVGYQAIGTPGRRLREGVQRFPVFGEEIPVRARVMSTDAFSAHADQGELLRWLRGFGRAPDVTYAVHGEPEAAAALRLAIETELGWTAEVAADGARVPL
jgi:metallo-beta-lactamase family protein